MLKRPCNIPFARKQQKMSALQILNPLCVACQIQRFGVEILISYPSDKLIGHMLKNDIDIVFVFETILNDVELQAADGTQNRVAFHALAHVFAKDDIRLIP